MVLGSGGEGLLRLHHLEVVSHPGGEAVPRLLHLLAGEREGALGHSHALVGRLQIEEHRLHLVVDPSPQVRETGPFLLHPGLGLPDMALDASALEERHSKRSTQAERRPGAGDVVSDGAVVPAHHEGRQPLAPRCLAERLRRLDPCLCGLEVGTSDPGPLDRLLGGQRDGERRGHGVHEQEALPQGQADGAGEGQLLLGRVLLGHDQPLAERLLLDLGPQHLDPRPEARGLAVPGHGEKRLRGVELCAGGGDPALTGDRLQVELPADQHHEVARAMLVLARRLERVGGGSGAMERLQVQDRLLEVRPRVEDVERADDLGDAGSAEAVGGEVHLLPRLDDSRAQLRQEIGPGGGPSPLRARGRGPAQDRAQVVAQAPFDRFGQREGGLVLRGLARRHAALQQAERARLLRSHWRCGQHERQGDGEERTAARFRRVKRAHGMLRLRGRQLNIMLAVADGDQRRIAAFAAALAVRQ